MLNSESLFINCWRMCLQMQFIWVLFHQSNIQLMIMQTVYCKFVLLKQKIPECYKVDCKMIPIRATCLISVRIFFSYLQSQFVSGGSHPFDQIRLESSTSNGFNIPDFLLESQVTPLTSVFCVILSAQKLRRLRKRSI